MPPRFTLKDGDGTVVTTQGDYAYAFRSKYTGPTSYLSLGMLPLRNNDVMRPAMCITRPNHDVWKIKNGNDMREYFRDSFPRLDVDSISAKEWGRFAQSEGTRFPPCTYSRGISICSPNGEAGVVFVGDAIHAFPVRHVGKYMEFFL